MVAFGKRREQLCWQCRSLIANQVTQKWQRLQTSTPGRREALARRAESLKKIGRAVGNRREALYFCKIEKDGGQPIEEARGWIGFGKNRTRTVRSLRRSNRAEELWLDAGALNGRGRARFEFCETLGEQTFELDEG